MILRTENLIPVLLGLGAASVRAQDLPELTVETLVHGVHVIHGHPGGNVLVVETMLGLVLVDAQSGNAADSVLRVAERSTNAIPVMVINTHYHEDHLGGNSRFRSVGARIVAHANVPIRARVDTTIEELGWHRERAEEADLPTATIAGDTSFSEGGVRFELMTFGQAHTDGDLAIYLPDRNVLHTGDILEVDAFPFIDWWGGGSLAGTIAAVDRLLALVDDETVIVPGHGHVVDRAHMVTYRAMLVEVGDGVQKAIARGDDVRTTMGLGLASPYAEGRGGEPGARRFAGTLFLGLSAGNR